MNMRSAAALTVIGSIATLALAQSAADRLLPGSVVAGLRVEWRQDGQVLEYVVHNPYGTWAITELTLTIEYQPPPPEARPRWNNAPAQGSKRAQKPNEPVLNWEAFEALVNKVPPEAQQVVLAVAPSASSASHLELKRSERVAAVKATSGRGREPTTFENIRNMFR